MSELPKIAGTAGQWVDLDAGVYRWCSCGFAQTQPFCDDSHLKTAMQPVTFVLEKAEKVILCMCKHTRTPPFCDGSHARFAASDDFDEYL